MTQTKLAETPLAAQLLAALLGLGLMNSDREHVQEREGEDEAATQLARLLEARKMEQTISGLDPKMASAGVTVGAIVKIAAAVTVADGDMEKLASLLEQQGMDKEAIGALLSGLARAGGAALKGIGGAASAAGRLAVPAMGNTAKMLAAGGEAAAKSPGVLQRAGGWLSGQGSSLAAKGVQAAKAAPAAAAGAAAGGGSLLSGATKAKIVGGGALLGAGYLGMKGLQAGRDYMMQPTGEHHAPGPPNNVNGYGYPQY